MLVDQDITQEKNADLSAALGIDDVQQIQQVDGLKSLISALLPGADNMAPEFLNEMANELLNTGIAGAIAAEVKKLAVGQSSEAIVQNRIKEMILLHQNRMLQENQQQDVPAEEDSAELAQEEMVVYEMVEETVIVDALDDGIETVEIDEIIEIVDEALAEDPGEDEVEQIVEFDAVEEISAEAFEIAADDVTAEIAEVESDVPAAVIEVAALEIPMQPAVKTDAEVVPEIISEIIPEIVPQIVSVQTDVQVVAEAASVMPKIAVAPISINVMPVEAVVTMDTVAVAPVVVAETNVPAPEMIVAEIVADSPVAIAPLAVAIEAAPKASVEAQIAVSAENIMAPVVAEPVTETVADVEAAAPAAAPMMMTDELAPVLQEAPMVIIPAAEVEENFVQNEQDCVLPVMSVDVKPVLDMSSVVERNVVMLSEIAATEQDILQPVSMVPAVTLLADDQIEMPVAAVQETATVTAPVAVVYVERTLAEQISSVVEQAPMVDAAEKMIVDAVQPITVKPVKEVQAVLLKDNAKDVTTAPDVFVKNGPVYAQPVVEVASDDWYGDVLSAQMTSFYYGMKPPSQS